MRKLPGSGNEFNKSAVTSLEEWVKYLKTGCICPDTQALGLAEEEIANL